MIDMATMTATRFVKPIKTAWRSPDILLKPAFAKMSFKIVENRIDPRELIEHRDADCQENGEPVLPLKERLGAVSMFNVEGIDDVLQLRLDILFFDKAQYDRASSTPETSERASADCVGCQIA